MPTLRLATSLTGLLIGITLAAGAAAAAPDRDADSAERAGDKRDRMICKRFVETGSLVKGYRTCKTKAEWDHEREDLRTPRTTGDNCPSTGGC